MCQLGSNTILPSHLVIALATQGQNRTPRYYGSKDKADLINSLRNSVCQGGPEVPPSLDPMLSALQSAVNDAVATKRKS
jgi:hypothetical protein